MRVWELLQLRPPEFRTLARQDQVLLLVYAGLRDGEDVVSIPMPANSED